MRRKEHSAAASLLRGGAAGMMTAGAVWWLLLPSLDWASAEGALPAFLPVGVGFALGYGLGRGRVCRLGAAVLTAALLCALPGAAAPWLGGFWAGVLLRQVVAARLTALSSPADAGGYALGFTLIMSLAAFRAG